MSILTRKASLILSCVLCLVFCVLCLVPVAPAQEVEVEVDAAEADDVVIIETEDDDIIIEGEEIIFIDDSDDEDQVIDMDDSDPAEFDPDRRDSMDVGRQPRQRERDRQRPGGRLPPAVRRIMEEENISPEDMRDPEVRQKVFEKVRRMRVEAMEGSQPGQDSIERGRKEPEAEPGKEGLELYMTVIAKKNLFLPLGSGDEKRRSSFALTAVISGPEDKAIIEERGGRRSFYVAEGDTFADEIEVVDIEEQVVKLDRSGEEEELRLGEGTEGGRRGGGRRSREGQRGEGRPDGAERSGGESDGNREGDFNPNQIPPFARRILRERGISIDELRGNPELRNRLRREFENRFGGGRRPQPMMLRDGRGDRNRRQR